MGSRDVPAFIFTWITPSIVTSMCPVDHNLWTRYPWGMALRLDLFKGDLSLTWWKFNALGGDQNVYRYNEAHLLQKGWKGTNILAFTLFRGLIKQTLVDSISTLKGRLRQGRVTCEREWKYPIIIPWQTTRSWFHTVMCKSTLFHQQWSANSFCELVLSWKVGWLYYFSCKISPLGRQLCLALWKSTWWEYKVFK